MQLPRGNNLTSQTEIQRAQTTQGPQHRTTRPLGVSGDNTNQPGCDHLMLRVQDK